jgi:hypothetical protein
VYRPMLWWLCNPRQIIRSFECQIVEVVQQFSYSQTSSEIAIERMSILGSELNFEIHVRLGAAFVGNLSCVRS